MKKNPKEMVDDNKLVISSRKWKKYSQYNVQYKKDKH